jgi:hypothetical protein
LVQNSIKIIYIKQNLKENTLKDGNKAKASVKAKKLEAKNFFEKLQAQKNYKLQIEDGTVMKIKNF